MLMKKYILPALIGLGIITGGAWYWSRLPKYGAGAVAPDFQFQRPDGSMSRLSDKRGSVVLLQFWGSWCGPCRRENKILSPLYARYHAEGLEVVSVAIERNSQIAWQKAIAADGLNWPDHAIETGSFSGPIASLYNIHEIPATYLINRSGQIVASHLPDDQLAAAVAAELAKK
jgi:thiol-disulfide isomerase/thioredoxin